ncbi:MAG: hypothetical protein EAX95_00080 [Candidatus Thorarchaeota archaeon]|nr:hypothetical protein [Candidatus Thorarchaeota archaeon]
MSSSDPLKLIEQYLERVKVYLSYDSEDALVEIRTHLIEEAERIGEGRMTAGSALMAIERMGDPKAVANEYADSGEKVGPVPTEYVQPLTRVLIVLFGLSLAFIVGAYVVGVAFNELFGATPLDPLAIPIMIVVNLIIAFSIIGGITLLDRDKAITEKTTLEGLLGVGGDALKPKPRWDAIGEAVMGVIFMVVLVLPPLVITYTSTFLLVLPVLIALLGAGALKGTMFAVGGENNLNLLFEALLSFLWILFAAVLVNVGWPTTGFWANNNGVWQIYDIATLFADMELEWLLPFNWIWIFIIFMVVVTSIWRLIAASMKVTMYLRQGKGLWWKGTWGERHTAKRGFWRRFRKSTPDDEQGSRYQDGYQESFESQ